MAEAFIYDAVRTPRGKGRKDGKLHEIPPIQLATQVLAAIRDRTGIDTADVDDVVLGCVSPVGEQGADIARIAVLNAGRLQQLGTPMELYQWPANLFVAQFIGSPPMNLLPVQAIGSAQVQLGSRKLAVEGPLAEALAARTGQELTGGLRPEHFQLAPATNRNLKAEVSHGEALGNEQLLTCRLEEGGHLVQVRVGPETILPPGASLNLDIDPRGWRLFDASGEALPLPPDRAALPELKLP